MERHHLTTMEGSSSSSSSASASSMDVVENSEMTDLDCSKQQIREVRQPFPVKVYEMLDEADPKGFSHIVSWNSKGTGFMVFNKEMFTKLIVPHYFNQTKYKSFQRQLSLYGFQRVTVGQDKGLRYHEKLRRGERGLVRQMKPVGYRPRGTGRISDVQAGSETITATASPMTASQAVPGETISGITSPNAVNIPNGTLNEQQQDLNISVMRSQDDTAMAISNDGMVGLPTVISSNSLDRHGQEPTVKDQTLVQRQDHQVPQEQVHFVSPGQSPVHFPCGVQSEDESCSGKEEEVEQELGLFEGFTFYLMPPNQELVEEMIPAPCLVNLPPCVIAAFSSAACYPPAVDSDVQLTQGWEVNLSRSNEAPHRSDGATPSASVTLLPTLTPHARPTTIPAPLPPSPNLLLDHCVDALDFHAVDVTISTV